MNDSSCNDQYSIWEAVVIHKFLLRAQAPFRRHADHAHART